MRNNQFKINLRKPKKKNVGYEMYISTLDYYKRENKLVIGTCNEKLDNLTALSSSVNVVCNVQ